jgi:hypothetical protein
MTPANSPHPISDPARIPHPRRHDDPLARRYADLLAATRAAVAAEEDGEADPLWYVHDELSAQDAAEEAQR